MAAYRVASPLLHDAVLYPVGAEVALTDAAAAALPVGVVEPLAGATDTPGDGEPASGAPAGAGAGRGKARAKA